VWDQVSQSFPLGSTYYLTGSGWKNAQTTFDADGTLLDLNKAIAVTIPTGNPTQTVWIGGFVPTSAQIQTVQNSGYTVAGSLFPRPVALSASGLKESGFVGNNRQTQSDYVYFFNRTTGLWDVRVWLDGSGNWRNSDASLANTNQLIEGNGYLIWRGNRSGNMSWTNPVPYTVPLAGP
jgi:hypothetical protein